MPLRRVSWFVVPLALAGCRPAPLPPPTLGMWYWHTPFRVTASEERTLDEMGVTTLYVRAGTFTTDGKRAHIMLPQLWESHPKKQQIVLTYNFDAGLVSHLKEIPIVSLAADVSREILASRKRAEASGIQPVGIQLDVDCPTSKLPRYAELLRAIRKQVKGEFTITALPTWLGSKNFAQVAKAVDAVVPQFYEGETGQTLIDLQPVSNPDAIRKGMAQLERLGCPAYAGLATYGHALLYSPQGRLQAMYQGLSPEDALRHPSLRLRMASPIGESGEDRLVVDAIAPDQHGRGQGVSIAYVIPTVEMVRRQWSAFQQPRPANVRGAILYRFPEPSEAMALDLDTVRDGLQNLEPKANLTVDLRAQAVPFQLIGTASAAHRPPTDLVIKTKMGDSPSMATPGAVTVLLHLNRPGIEAWAPGDFDDATPVKVNADGTFTPRAPAHSDGLLLRRHHALARESLRSGVVTLGADGATKATVEWSIHPPGGLPATKGSVRNISIESGR